MSAGDNLTVLAVLTAKPDQTEALKAALVALIAPTRQEPGNISYELFQLTETPEIFHMRECWQSQAALDDHVATPHFQSFVSQMDLLLNEPLAIVPLKQVSV
nr:putative quinol monooxygenase [Pseudescherichia sp.]